MEDFSDAETKVLCALTYFTLPTKVEHVAAIAGLAKPDTDRALRSLTVRSLAVPTDELTAFTLVPMVGYFLWEKKSKVVVDTGFRLEQCAYSLIIENGYKNYDRFLTLEAVWPSLAPALALFLSGDNGRLQTICHALEDFLDFHGRWDELLALHEKAEAKAVAANDHDSASLRAYHAGYIYYLRKQVDEVFACADRVVGYSVYAKIDNRKQVIAIRLRGLGYELKKDYPAAIAACREVLDLGADSKTMAAVLNDLANAEKESGDFAAAEVQYREALRLAEVADDAVGVAVCTGNLAELALDRADWLAAETLAREALSLSQALHRQELTAGANRYLAVAFLRQGKAAEALPHAQRAVELYTRLDHPDLAKAQATLTECEG